MAAFPQSLGYSAAVTQADPGFYAGYQPHDKGVLTTISCRNTKGDRQRERGPGLFSLVGAPGAEGCGAH